MYLDWVLPSISILLICILIYGIYYITTPLSKQQWVNPILSEPFVVTMPTQQYAIPQLSGVKGRYVRIRPSITHGDGYLTISQILVLDNEGNNMALKANVTATSQGGSPVDQKYGLNILYGGVYNLAQGVSNGPKCIVDGTLIPRFGLTNVFETSVQNVKDDQWVEIDLGANTVIQSVVYIGRQDSQNRYIETEEGLWDRLTQVDRLTNMRLEIYDLARNIVFQQLFSDDPDTHKTTISIKTPLFTLNEGSSVGTQIISVPNMEFYTYVQNKHRRGLANQAGAHPLLVKEVNKLYVGMDLDVNEKGLFNILLTDAPLNFYNEIYLAGGNTPPTNLSPTTTVTVFGTASAAAIAEMNASIDICKCIFLGSPAFVENYVRINLTDLQPYIRNTPQSTNLCFAEIVQRFQGGGYVTSSSSTNQAWNATRCTRKLDATSISLIPFTSRNFLVQWIRDRSGRYINFTKSGTPTSINLPVYIDITSANLFNSIAQQFYEFLGGQFSMGYIYDVLPLGSTMLDVRFDLAIHTSPTLSYGPIADLKNQYKNFTNSKTITQDMAERAGIDYETELAQREQGAIDNLLQPFRGAVVRLFYTNSSGSVTITGMIFDANGVTSFNQALNGGLQVPLGSMDGNVNYTPTIKYTLNVPKDSMDCKDPDVIRRILNDYTNMVESDKKILLATDNPMDISKGQLFINRVGGSTQVSPTQCAIQWDETLYNPVTNAPIGLTGTLSNYISNVCGLGSITRYALFSYKADYDNWTALTYTFDIPGFKFLSPISKAGTDTTVIPACRFDSISYSKSVGNRFDSLGTSAAAITAIKDDYLKNAFKNGTGAVCNYTIPNYTFSATDYAAANPGVSASNAVADFTAKIMTTNPILRLPVVITSMSEPITYTKPLPPATKLDNASGICTTTACDDLDVLFSLVKQYNANPSLPGTILRVKRAYTPNQNQCDVEVDINYDSMIQDLYGVTAPDMVTRIPTTTYAMIKKGTVKYSAGANNSLTSGSKAMTHSGIQTANMAFYVAMDKPTCSYMLVDAGDQGTGYSIQPNTPLLYKPLNYVTEMNLRGSAATGSSVGSIQANYAATSGSAKAALTAYRANTYAAIGSINQPLESCPGKGCADTALLNSMMNYYSNLNNNIIQMSRVIRTGSLDKKSCDLTFTTNTQQTLGGRFTLGMQGNSCTVTGYTSITPTPTYTDVQNIGTPLSTANMVASGFTDYTHNNSKDLNVNFVNPDAESKEYINATEDTAYPLKGVGFGKDRSRNSGDNTSIRKSQYDLPLVQTVPGLSTAEGDITAYKYVRFRTLKTRSPTSDAVHVGKFTFYLGDKAVLFEGKVSNPMGTWDGALKDVVGAGLRAGFYDAHKKPLVFAFKKPVALDGYSFTTAAPGKGIENDPIAWKVEGSMTGTYWTVLDEQARYPTPVERYKEIALQRFYAAA